MYFDEVLEELLLAEYHPASTHRTFPCQGDENVLVPNSLPKPGDTFEKSDLEKSTAACLDGSRAHVLRVKPVETFESYYR